MNIIDHNPNERRETNTIWWVLWPVILASWAVLIYFDRVEWISAIGGLGTGCLLATWALEITGGKTPQSWIDGARRTRGLK